MRIFSISPSGVTESATLPTQAPDQGYVWIACARTEFETRREEVQATLQALAGAALVDLHISDLLNKQLPSRFDYTSMYDLLVFRRLSSGDGEPAPAPAPTGEPPLAPRRRGGPPVLRRIDTSPIGFAVFDQVMASNRRDADRLAWRNPPGDGARLRRRPAPRPRRGPPTSTPVWAAPGFPPARRT